MERLGGGGKASCERVRPVPPRLAAWTQSSARLLPSTTMWATGDIPIQSCSRTRQPSQSLWRTPAPAQPHQLHRSMGWCKEQCAHDPYTAVHSSYSPYIGDPFRLRRKSCWGSPRNRAPSKTVASDAGSGASFNGEPGEVGGRGDGEQQRKPVVAAVCNSREAPDVENRHSSALASVRDPQVGSYPNRTRRTTVELLPSGTGLQDLVTRALGCRLVKACEGQKPTSSDEESNSRSMNADRTLTRKR